MFSESAGTVPIICICTYSTGNHNYIIVNMKDERYLYESNLTFKVLIINILKVYSF